MRNLFCGLLLTTAALFTGCVADKGECPAEPDASRYTLRLDVVVPIATTSRAGVLDPNAATPEENHIDMAGGDYDVIVYDAEGNCLTDMVNMTETRVETTDNSTIYTLIGAIDASVDPKRLESFRVMVLANWCGFDPGRSNYPAQATFADYSAAEGADNSIYKEDSDFNFKAPNISSSAAWMPGATTGYLPMFGVSDLLKIDEGAKEGSSSMLNTTIYMLRSVAKVEIVDDMPQGQSITAVSLSRSAANGRFIPDIEENASWNVPGTQVAKVSLPAATGADEDVTDLQLVKGTRTIDGAEKTVYTAYIPEMLLFSEVTGKPRPTFSVTVNGNTTPNTFTFDNYYDGAVNSANKLYSVLRNHIYRYTVSGTSANLDLTSSVDPWDMEWEEYPSNFELPSVAEGGYITFVTKKLDEEGNETEENDTRFSVNKENLRFITSAAPQEYATVRFTLDRPMYGKWVASLRRTSGETDAFYFTTGATADDGSLVPGGDSGTIMGTEIELRIACKYETVVDENNEATLIIEVEYPDKSRKEVYVVPPEDYVVKPNETVKNYTIVQQITKVI